MSMTAAPPGNRGRHTRRAAISLALLISATAIAQTGTLPAPSRTVYKCEAKGRVVYSDSPCVGAEVIDVTPTRGLNKSSGRERVGADVQRERHRELMAEALRPLTGKSAEEMQVLGQRQKLAPALRAECVELDGAIARGEASEQSATGGGKRAVQRDLFESRRRHREIGC